MPKDSTSKRISAPTKTTRKELRAKLARDLAAVLDNPVLPVSLYNGISAAVTDFQSTCIDYNDLLYSEETLAKMLAMYAGKGGA